MKYEINNCEVFTIDEVVEQLRDEIEIELLSDGESIDEFGDNYLHSDEIEIECIRHTGDVRIDGKFSVYVDIDFIRNRFTEAEFCTFAKDENGEDVLLCFM